MIQVKSKIQNIIMQIKIKPVTVKLIVMNFLEFAVWGAYLTSLGR